MTRRYGKWRSYGGFTLNISGRQELQEKIRKGTGGVWLELTPEQYAKLRKPS